MTGVPAQVPAWKKNPIRIATIVAVVIEIGIGGAILFPLLVVPACATAVGAAIRAGRMHALADRR